jgi:uncharacterized protein
MTESTQTNGPRLTQFDEPPWLTRLARRRPDVVLMAPFMAYLLLMGLGEQIVKLSDDLIPVVAVIRGAGSLWVVWMFRRHFPPLGRAHWGIAIGAGVLVAAGWVAGQHFFNTIHIGEKSLGGRLFLFPGQPDASDPRIGLSAISWWSQVVMRITVATLAVPVVEELFWRGFLLRALIDWHNFEKVPLGAFTWYSFLGTALLSTLQHPDNWAVSILCWFAYNALMYWKKSLLCLMLTHGITNLVLYVYVIWAGDWLFW